MLPAHCILTYTDLHLIHHGGGKRTVEEYAALFYSLEDATFTVIIVFSATLTNLQQNNCLSEVDSWTLFANLNELCLVSFSFLNNLLRVIKNMLSISQGAGPTLLELLSKASVTHIYYEMLIFTLPSSCHESFRCLLPSPQWCERNEQCRRLQLRDLLVAPLQRLTRYPLLLRNIAKRCQMFEESRELQSLKHLLKAVTLDNLISHRSLLHEGKLVLTGVYSWPKSNAFLKSISSEQNHLRLQQNLELDQLLKEGCTFMVLDQPISLDRLQLRNIDQLNASSNYTSSSIFVYVLAERMGNQNIMLGHSSVFTCSDVCSYFWYLMTELSASFTASGLPHSFIIMHHNRYQQCIGAFILQAPSESAKVGPLNHEFMTGFRGHALQ
ncbi:hypothetical protein XENOCAPTIV_013478 [Xenoophorus captivus]|uniref:DH domain-containing protein n=1 Tax=Xenoophorus captivus TaxID=1517983 RepID=A0ABV0RSG3_9TELE